MATPTPTFRSITYVDRWGVLLPGTQQIGVVGSIGNGGSAPSGWIAIAMLAQGGAAIGYGVGASPNTVAVVPSTPLVSSGSYTLAVQFAAPGTDPSSADWSGSQVASGPVIATTIALVGGVIGAQASSFAWSAGDAAPPGYGYVQVFDVAGGSSVGYVLTPGGGGHSSFAIDPARTYAAYASSVSLIDPKVPNVYSFGPWSPAIAIPAAGPTITSVGYDGRTLAVAWQPPAIGGGLTVVDTEYDLMVSSGSNPIARARGTATGAATDVSLVAFAAPVTVSAVARWGGMVGPASSAATAIVAAPGVVSVSIQGESGGAVSIMVVLANAKWPSGTTLTVSLLQDGASIASATASGSPPTATLTATLAQLPRYEIVAQATSTGASVTVIGPHSKSVPVIGAAVAQVACAYDGESLTVSWQAIVDPVVTGYVITTTGAVAMLLTTAREVVSLPARLQPGAAVNVQVMPMMGCAVGLPAVLPYTVPPPAAPTAVAARVLGNQIVVGWTPSAGPWLDGYRVRFASQGATPAVEVDAYAGLDAELPLSLLALAAAQVWSISVAATANGAFGADSSAAVICTWAPQISSVSIAGGSASVAWSIEGLSSGAAAALAAASAQILIEILDGPDPIASGSVAVSTARTGTVALALPTRVTANRWATARLITTGPAGPRSSAIAVLPSAPVVVFGALVDGALALRWSPSGDAGVTGYAIRCGALTASTPDTTIELPLPAGTPTSVSIQAIGTSSAGGVAIQAIGAAPAVTAATYDGANLTVTLSGSGTAPASTWVDVVVRGQRVSRTTVAGMPTAPIAIPIALPAGAAASVRAAGIGDGALTLPSAPLAIATTPVAIAAADYDDASGSGQLHVRWQPSSDPGVIGYVVTVSPGATPPTYVAGAGASSCTIAATLPAPFPGTAQVTAQAVTALDGHGGAAATGPGGRATPALAPHLRSIAAAAAGQPPYVYRRGAYQTLASIDQGAIVAYLPSVFVSGTPTVSSPDGTFSLAPVTSPAAGGPPYALTIARTVWTSFDGTAARATLRQSYRAFLLAVEAATGGVLPWAIPLVRQAIAAVMPQTFAETLYYRYGLWLDPSLRIVDLDPGLRLRVSGAAYHQVVGTSTDPRNGFVINGADHLDLSETYPDGSAQASLAPALTVDAFLARLFAGSSGAGTATATGATDFFAPGARQAYYRMFYPTALPPSGGTGSATPTANVLLVGAATWTALEQATDTYAQTGNLPPGAPLFTAYFRGRAAVTPLVAVYVDGESRWLIMGASLRQLAASLGVAPQFGLAVGGIASVARPTANLFDSPLGGSQVRMEPLDLSGADLGSTAPQQWPFDAPLLGGDRIDFAPPGPIT